MRSIGTNKHQLGTRDVKIQGQANKGSTFLAIMEIPIIIELGTRDVKIQRQANKGSICLTTMEIPIIIEMTNKEHGEINGTSPHKALYDIISNFIVEDSPQKQTQLIIFNHKKNNKIKEKWLKITLNFVLFVTIMGKGLKIIFNPQLCLIGDLYLYL